MTKGSAVLDEIERDLNLDNAKALGVFLKLAEQEERLAAKGQPAAFSPEQLLALALSGWLQGTEAADQSRDAAEKLLRGREFLQKFLLTDDDGQRGEDDLTFKLGDIIRANQNFIRWNG